MRSRQHRLGISIDLAQIAIDEKFAGVAGGIAHINGVIVGCRLQAEGRGIAYRQIINNTSI